MKNKEQISQKIQEEEDFIYCPRLGNSVKNLLETNSEGIDEERMSRVLLMSVEEIKEIYDIAITKLKNNLRL